MTDKYTINLNFDDVRFLMCVLNEHFYQKPVDYDLYGSILKQLNDIYINKKFRKYKNDKNDL